MSKQSLADRLYEVVSIDTITQHIEVRFLTEHKVEEYYEFHKVLGYQANGKPILDEAYSPWAEWMYDRYLNNLFKED